MMEREAQPETKTLTEIDGNILTETDVKEM